MDMLHDEKIMWILSTYGEQNTVAGGRCIILAGEFIFYYKESNTQDVSLRNATLLHKRSGYCCAYADSNCASGAEALYTSQQFIPNTVGIKIT